MGRLQNLRPIFHASYKDKYQFYINSTTFQIPDVFWYSVYSVERYVVSGAKSDFPLMALVMVSQGCSVGALT